MNKKTFFTIIIFIVIILIIIFLWTFKKEQNEDLFQDFLFTKLIGNFNLNSYSETQSNNEIKYFFDISYRNTKFKNINLQDTINKDTLVNEKIAPGTKGSFDIVLKANKDTQYKINFVSKNQKPENLKFRAKINDQYISEEKNNLEELSKYLIGNIYKNKEKIITIQWYWNYESSEKDNRQDTFDAQNLREYEFDIYTVGMEVDAT